MGRDSDHVDLQSNVTIRIDFLLTIISKSFLKICTTSSLNVSCVTRISIFQDVKMGSMLHVSPRFYIVMAFTIHTGSSWPARCVIYYSAVSEENVAAQTSDGFHGNCVTDSNGRALRKIMFQSDPIKRTSHRRLPWIMNFIPTAHDI